MLLHDCLDLGRHIAVELVDCKNDGLGVHLLPKLVEYIIGFWLIELTSNR